MVTHDELDPKRERMLTRAAEIVANTSTRLLYSTVSCWPDERLQNWLDEWESKDAHLPAVTPSTQSPSATWRLPAADERKLEPWLPPSANPCRL